MDKVATVTLEYLNILSAYTNSKEVVDGDVSCFVLWISFRFFAAGVIWCKGEGCGLSGCG